MARANIRRCDTNWQQERGDTDMARGEYIEEEYDPIQI